MTDDKQTPPIQNEEDYHRATRTITRQSQPPSVLRFLMRALETYRSARKMGWSRPWNKYDLVNFQSLKLTFPQDDNLIKKALSVIDAECDSMPSDIREFSHSLLRDEKLMGFIFAHEYTDGVRQFEGATLSFGRVSNKRFRDRLDIIVESEVIGGVSTGFCRTRIFVDPYRPNESLLWKKTVESLHKKESIELFHTLSNLSWSWADDAQRQWDHWTSAYIDYFGPRQWPMTQSFFHTSGAARLFRNPTDSTINHSHQNSGL